VNRAEHLAWAKARAIVYADAGQLGDALASIGSDLRKHPETRDHAGVELMAMLMFAGHLDTPREVRKFIEGFQ